MGRLCLVTGGAGFIGSHIVEALVDRGDQVRVVDNLCTGVRANLDRVAAKIDFHELDVADQRALRPLMQGVDTVFHQAALASVPLSVERPLDVNQACVTGTLNVLNEARLAGVRRVVYAASSAAYGDSPESEKTEAILPQTLSPYAVAKLAGEYYCQAFTKTYGLETVALRYFNVFGPRQDPDSPYSAVIPIFITHLLKRERPVIYGDGEQTRDFTYVGNVVDANLLAADAADVAGSLFNIADGRRTSLNRMLAALKHLLGSDIEPIFEPARPGDVKHSLANIDRARQQLGFAPKTDLETGLKLSSDYYKSVLIQPTP